MKRKKITKTLISRKKKKIENTLVQFKRFNVNHFIEIIAPYFINSMKDYLAMALLNKTIYENIKKLISHFSSNIIPSGLRCKSISMRNYCAIKLPHTNWSLNNQILRRIETIRVYHDENMLKNKCLCEKYINPVRVFDVIKHSENLKTLVIQNITLTLKIIDLYMSSNASVIIFIDCYIYNMLMYQDDPMDNVINKMSEKKFIFINCSIFEGCRNILDIHYNHCSKTISYSVRGVIKQTTRFFLRNTRSDDCNKINNFFISCNIKSCNLYNIATKVNDSMAIHKKIKIIRNSTRKRKLKSLHGKKFMKMLKFNFDINDVLNRALYGLSLSSEGRKFDNIKSAITRLIQYNDL